MILKDKGIKAVLFDLDGTLLNTYEGIVNSVKYTIDILGLTPLTELSLQSFVGPPIQKSLKKYFNLSDEQAQNGADIFRDHYMSKALLQAYVYDGILSLLDRLWNAKIHIGVATYKREDCAMKILDYFKISPYCTVIHGADNDNKLTKADIIRLCTNELCVSSNQVVLIGDTEYDAIGAQQACIPFIAVTWGFGYKGQSPVIDYPYMGVAHCPGDIWE